MQYKFNIGNFQQMANDFKLSLVLDQTLAKSVV